MMKLQIFVGKDGQHYVRMVSRNNKIMMASEGYVSERNAIRAAKKINEMFLGYGVIEVVHAG